jgi:uncharacterized NAD(P)/FAD-binding protein YdhS
MSPSSQLALGPTLKREADWRARARRAAAAPRALRPAAAALRVAVVGGGFAGAAAALRVIEATLAPLAVTIIEPRGRLGRGIAYSTPEPGHLMNGPARNLSLYSEAPLHFVHWLQAQSRRGGWRPNSAVGWEYCQPPRWLFGTYVETRLATVGIDYGDRLRLRHRRDRAVAIARLGEEFVVTLAESGALLADVVVLATGTGQRAAAGDHPRIIPDPYQPSAYERAAAAAEIVVLGTGLSMLDAVVSLERAGFHGRIRAVSRSGTMVEPRRTVPAATLRAEAVLSLRDLLRQVQEDRRALAAAGEDWQQLVPPVRAAVPDLWLRATPAERQRFLRHARLVWKKCIHLAPIESHRLAEALRAEGRLVLEAGEIEATAPGPDGRIAVQVCRPGGDREILAADLVISCLGPGSAWSDHRDPLHQSLLARGLARPHSTGLGIDIDPATHRVIPANGAPGGPLFALGAPVRGASWESTSVREIAAQAHTLGAAVARLPVAQRGDRLEMP